MSAVSRETAGVPDPTDGARAYFGAQLPVVARYAELLAGPGIERGLIGPREIPRVWDRHLLNCAVVQEVIPHNSTVADVGSGAGLPGVVLAILRGDLHVTLIEPQLRRTTFLAEIVDELTLGNVEVVRGRAEQVSGEVRCDVVTARAVAPVGKLAALCLPLIRPGGVLLAMKGRTVDDELAKARRALTALGVASVSVRTCGKGVVDPPVRLAEIYPGTGDRTGEPNDDSERTPRRHQG